MILGAGALFELQAAAAGARVVAANFDHTHRLTLGAALDAGCTVAGHKPLAGGLCHLFTLGGGTGLTYICVICRLTVKPDIET